MAAPALKPCPVCRGTDNLVLATLHGSAYCEACGMETEAYTPELAAADWNHLSDIAEARTRAAVRAALGEVKREAEEHPAMCHLSAEKAKTGMIEIHVIGEVVGVYEVIEMIDDALARLDAAPSAQSEGDEDADR